MFPARGDCQEMSIDETTRDPRLGRRLLVLRLAGLGAATLGTGCAMAQPMGPGGVTPVRTDADPYDRAGYGHGRSRTDSDPRDSAGYGRGRSMTDNDPRDSAGYGRGHAPP